MSEKRFANVGGVEEFVHLVFDNETARTLSVKQTVQKLNEQQAIISQLQDLCGKSDYENAKLRIKNKEMQSKIDKLCELFDYGSDDSDLDEVSNKNSTDQDMTFGEFIKRHQYMNSIDVMTYELYLILKNLQRLTGE